MKKRLILSILLLAAFGLQARAQRKIAGTRTADFTIVYCSALEDEEGIDAARTLRQELAGAEQPELRILPDTAFRRGRAIRSSGRRIGRPSTTPSASRAAIS